PPRRKREDARDVDASPPASAERHLHGSSPAGSAAPLPSPPGGGSSPEGGGGVPSSGRGGSRAAISGILSTRTNSNPSSLRMGTMYMTISTVPSCSGSSSLK